MLRTNVTTAANIAPKQNQAIHLQLIELRTLPGISVSTDIDHVRPEPWAPHGFAQLFSVSYHTSSRIIVISFVPRIVHACAEVHSKCHDVAKFDRSVSVEVRHDLDLSADHGLSVNVTLSHWLH